MSDRIPVAATVPCDRIEHTKRAATKGCEHSVALELDKGMRRARIKLDGFTALSLTVNEYTALEQLIVAAAVRDGRCADRIKLGSEQGA